MRLQSLEYVERAGEPEEWTLTGLALGDINLLVGKNASGKTRILNIINNLAQSISGTAEPRKIFAGQFHLIFNDEGSRLEYELEVLEEKVAREVFKVDGKPYLDRSAGGKGKIFAVKLDTEIDFQTPDNQLAVTARQDAIQHPYFEPLHQWASSLYFYAFSTLLGKDRFPIFFKSDSPGSEINPKDASQIVAIFHKGKKDFKDRFIEAIKKDFEAIGYPIDDIDVGPPRSIKVRGPIPGEISCIYVKETDLPGITDQHAMSNGMFRALSIIILVTYSELADMPSCILIDDIGEGLDFERSCNLIELLMSKARNSSVQLVMSTNDRFIMNQVPLESWSILDRKANHVSIRNYSNSKEIFDNFKFTGLNNFDFLAFDYLHAGKRNE